MITPLPGAIELKAGSATRPFFGVQPALEVDSEAIRKKARRKAIWSSPILAGRARLCSAIAERFERAYFSTFKNM